MGLVIQVEMQARLAVGKVAAEIALANDDLAGAWRETKLLLPRSDTCPSRATHSRPLGGRAGDRGCACPARLVAESVAARSTRPSPHPRPLARPRPADPALEAMFEAARPVERRCGRRNRRHGYRGLACCCRGCRGARRPRDPRPLRAAPPGRGRLAVAERAEPFHASRRSTWPRRRRGRREERVVRVAGAAGIAARRRRRPGVAGSRASRAPWIRRGRGRTAVITARERQVPSSPPRPQAA